MPITQALSDTGWGFIGLLDGKGSWRIQPLAHRAAFMGMNMNMHDGSSLFFPPSTNIIRSQFQRAKISENRAVAPSTADRAQTETRTLKKSLRDPLLRRMPVRLRMHHLRMPAKLIA
ncbi:hypothetical protein BJ912DRAFT_1039131 [Pholiota molesta]|nr:hypothetical protein BJ912DRAFT_1039131 [Pholiota molesta]